MHPVLLELPSGVAVRSYGVLCLVGVAVGVSVVLRAGVRAGVPRKRLVDLTLWAIVAGLVGSKLLLLAVNADEYASDPWTWVDLFGAPRRVPRALVLWQGGLVYYGGILGGALAAAIYSRLARLDLATVADVIAPGLSLGHVWGRLACFLAGCCHGKAAPSGVGASFGFGSQAYEAHSAAGLLLPPYERTYPLHPVQLYEAGVELVIAGALLWLLPRRRYRGQVALAYLTCYSAARFVLEAYRGDVGRGFVGEPISLASANHLLGVDGGSPTLLSVSQLLSVLCLLVCGWVWLLHRHRRGRRPAPEGRAGA